jgi:hypothetical protein
LSVTDFSADAKTPPDDLVHSVIQGTRQSGVNVPALASLDRLSAQSENSGLAGATLPSGVSTSDALSTAAILTTDSTNQAPYISDFYCINDFGTWWTLTGYVTDADDPVEGDVITFGGVLAEYNLTTTVDVDGVFCLSVSLHGLHSGIATAQTSDPHGALSNVAMYWIIG